MPVSPELLRALPYLRPLPEQQIQRLRTRAIHQVFPRGRIILLDHEPCPGVYLIETGRVKLYKTSPDGREQILMLVGPGASFNDVPVFDGGPNPVAAAAMERASVYLLPSAEVLDAVRSHPEAALALAREFAGRIRTLSSLIEDLSFRHVTSRVAKILLQYAEQRDPSSPRPRLTQQELAAMVGSVREVVGRALAGLEREGAIRIDRARIVVTDREALRRMT